MRGAVDGDEFDVVEAGVLPISCACGGYGSSLWSSEGDCGWLSWTAVNVLLI